MKTSTHDKIHGNATELKGKAKEVAGKLTGNRRLQAEGRDEQVAGKVQVKIGEVEKVLDL